MIVETICVQGHHCHVKETSFEKKKNPVQHYTTISLIGWMSNSVPNIPSVTIEIKTHQIMLF